MSGADYIFVAVLLISLGVVIGGVVPATVSLLIKKIFKRQ